MNTFCRWMNMPPSMAETNDHDINNCIHNAYVETSHESMTMQHLKSIRSLMIIIKLQVVTL